MLLFFCSTLLFASKVEGKWKATIETDNGPFTFYAEYTVKGDKITGTLSSDMGSVEIANGKIDGDEYIMRCIQTSIMAVQKLRSKQYLYLQ